MEGAAGFGDTLADASVVIQKQKKTKNDIAGPMLLVLKYEKSTLKEFLKLYGGMETSASSDYTNLGVLDNKKLVFDGANVKYAVGYSGLNKAPCFQIAVSSFKGETTISTLVKCGKEKKESRCHLRCDGQRNQIFLIKAEELFRKSRNSSFLCLTFWQQNSIIS